MKRLLVILAAESYIIRKGFSAVLNAMKGVSVLREVSSADRLTELLETLSPDYCFLCEQSLEYIRGYLSEKPEWYSRIIVISMHPDDKSDLPCCAAIGISDPKELLINKIEQALFTENNDFPKEEEDLLSNREKTILGFLCKGFTNKQIAEILFLSAHTVNTHRKNISNKLGIKSLSSLTVYAILNNLITIEEVAMNLENES